MREFNTFGPVNPTYHYHVNRLTVKTEIKQKIKKRRYFTLNAARQTGKTTLFQEVIAELEAEEKYLGLLLNFEDMRSYTLPRFYERLTQLLSAIPWATANHSTTKATQSTSPAVLRDHGDFSDWLQRTIRHINCPVLLIIDEFDAISPEIAEPMLAVFRKMYINRHNTNAYSLQSLILVGVKNIPSLLGGSQSPFNIADQYQVPYFTNIEIAELLNQHTIETGQPFTPPVIEAICVETEGQPFLVNRLANILTVDTVPDQNQAITLTHFNQALVDLLSEQNTHFSSITSKAMPHQVTLLPILFYNEKRSNFRHPITQELLMYGILRQVRENNFWIARIANPIYRKMLILTFTPPNGITPLNGSVRHRYLVNSVLNMDGLLNAFKQMMEEHGIRLLRSKKTNHPLEIGGQYLLLSYLTAALDSIGGHITLESINSAGEMDLLVFYQQSQFIIETKIWHGLKHFETGKQQLAHYLKATTLNKGYMVLFSEKNLSNIPNFKSTTPFETTYNNYQLYICPIIIK